MEQTSNIDPRIDVIKKALDTSSGFTYTIGARTFKVSPKAIVPILYIGGRRCGKTTIMASVYANAIKSSAAKGGLQIVVCDIEQDKELTKAKSSLKAQATAGALNLYGIPAGEKISVYNFLLYSTNDTAEDACVLLRFIDVPGEVYDNPTEEEKAEWAYILDKTKIMLIAVDTVSLMESKDSDKNYYDFNIISSIEGIFDNIGTAKERKLVLFVPVKCEKYCIENKQTEIISSLESKYAKVISKIKESSPSNVIAFTPVQTVGTLVFACYASPVEGADTSGQEFRSDTKLISVLQEVYAPLCCEQVLWYIFRFIFADAGVDYRQGAKKGLFRRILESLMDKFNKLKNNLTASYTTLSVIKDYKVGQEAYDSTKSLSDAELDKVKRRQTVCGIIGDRAELGYRIYSDADNLFSD